MAVFKAPLEVYIDAESPAGPPPKITVSNSNISLPSYYYILGIDPEQKKKKILIMSNVICKKIYCIVLCVIGSNPNVQIGEQLSK